MTASAVCFDLDDTLYPYAEYARSGLRNAADELAAVTGEHLREELFDLYFEEEVTEETFDRLVAENDLPAELVDRLVEAYHDAVGPLEPYDDTVPVLEELDERYRLGLVTDGYNGLRKLDALGLRPKFDAVVVTPPLNLTKAQREPFDRVTGSLDIDHEEMVYVGDDPRVDFGVPNRLGAGTVRLRRGRYTHLSPATETAEPETEVASLAELPAALADNGW